MTTPTSKVHLEGMGILGSLCGLALEERGLDWTWSDTDASVNAWRACTGAVFPTGEAEYELGRLEWLRRCSDPFWDPYLERASWWYCTKGAPHGSRAKPTQELGALRQSSEDSVHFNAQRFVPAMRQRFLQRRTTWPPVGAFRVVSHGFGPRLHHYVWGWTARVQVAAIDPRRPVETQRSAYYFRRGRFEMAYAYPVPGEPWWYAGSSLIVQKKNPHDLVVPPKVERWRQLFEALSGRGLRVTAIGDATSGWRPAAAEQDEAEAWREVYDFRTGGFVLAVRPHWHDGVRRSPSVVAELLRRIGS